MMSGVLFLLAKKPTSLPLDRRVSTIDRPSESGDG